METKAKRYGLVLTFWGMIVVVMSVLWGTPLGSGQLPDSDDYMRMLRIFDILDHTGSPSYIEPRLGVAGSEMGWSRLADWPLVALQAAGEFFLHDRTQAALLTTTIIPSFLVLVLLLGGLFYAKPVTGDKTTAFILLVTFLQWGLLRQFIPGRVDHHMWQILLLLFAYGGLVRIYLTPEKLLPPIIAGLTFATGLAIGADILPWLALGAALTAFFWFMEGERYEKPALVFGFTLLSSALSFHLLLTPPERLTFLVCDSLSPFWVSLTVAVAVFWAIIKALPASWKEHKTQRFMVGVAVSVPLLFGLYGLFPSCFQDPYMLEDTVVRRIWLNSVLEAQSLPELWRQSAAATSFLIIPLILGLTGSITGFFKDKDRQTLWAGLTLVLFGALMLGCYQVRTVDFAQALVILPLSWVCVYLSRRAEKKKGRAAQLSSKQVLVLNSIFFLLCLLSLVLAISNGNKASLLTDKQAKASMGCNVEKAAAVLNTIPGSLTVAAHIDIGAEILFRTKHRVLAAPYHRNENGIRAAYDIFTAADAKSARSLMEKNNIDILVFCPMPNNFWIKVAPQDRSFIKNLVEGSIPSWLEPVGSSEHAYKIYKRKSD